MHVHHSLLRRTNPFRALQKSRAAFFIFSVSLMMERNRQYQTHVIAGEPFHQSLLVGDGQTVAQKKRGS